jgi:hypothetical protein
MMLTMRELRGVVYAGHPELDLKRRALLFDKFHSASKKVSAFVSRVGPWRSRSAIPEISWSVVILAKKQVGASRVGVEAGRYDHLAAPVLENRHHVDDSAFSQLVYALLR